MAADPLDAVRDALALLRAVHAGDTEGIEAVAGNLALPELTAVVLAEMLDGCMTANGDRLGVLDAWQRKAGL